MNTPLDDLDDLYSVYFDNDAIKGKHGITEKTAKEKYENIRKALKALEIIKKEGINTDIFNRLEDYDDYLAYCESSEAFKTLFEYTQEEFDLLREVLE